MKKLLSVATVATLLVTSANAVDNNRIEIMGNILAGAVVWIGDSQNTPLTAGNFIFEGNSVDLENMVLGEDTIKSMPLSVRTNSTSGVKMTIEDATNNGNLADGSKAKIAMSYKLDSLGDLTLGEAKSLVAGVNDGTTAIDNFTVKATVPADQEAGTYKTTLTVTIAAN